MSQQFSHIPDNKASNDIFNLDRPLVCKLIFDIKKFRKEKSAGKYQDARFIMYLADNTTIESKCMIKLRGESRRKLCNFPPIKIKFEDPDFPYPYFNKIKNQKLVTHCKSSGEYEQNLLKEYLVYKMYNVLTEKSFHVQLMRMTYEDSESKTEPITRYAFVIEEPDILAEKNNSFYIKDENLGMRYIEMENIMILSLFQFMIGNLDWSVTGQHNLKLLKSKNYQEKQPYAVPYDFDNSGMVHPSYAEPPESSGLGSILVRKFEGICASKEAYDKIVDQFENHNSDFYSLINNLDLIEDTSKDEMLDYLASFYELVNSQKFYKKYITPNCKD